MGEKILKSVIQSFLSSTFFNNNELILDVPKLRDIWLDKNYNSFLYQVFLFF
jgi:hypothetical protein